jgi:B12-binding domain/radical SAM domain protein
MSLDLVLLHAPHVYDFRKKTILYGPVSDLVPASPVFEMYPFGLVSMAEYLERAGFRVRIVNLAVRMLKDKDFDAERLIKRLKSPVFGIDLHWLVHAHGAVEVARLVKKYHPQSKVLMGGFSASYFYKELLDYPEIDYVLRGDSTEEPLRQLIDSVKNRKPPEAVPNLVWRDDAGQVRENQFSYVPDDIGNVMVDHYHGLIRSVIRHRDLMSIIPVKDWLRYPITAAFTCRGCNNNCIICGGSNSAFRNFLNREKTAFRSPQDIARDIKSIGRFSNSSIFILGDIRQPGDACADELLSILARDKVKNRLMLEIFSPASAEFLHKLSLACPNFCLEISPESHDTEVRKAAGKLYSNEALEQTIVDALEIGCGRLDIFFMVGLPKQTEKSVMETIDYCEYLLDRFKGDNRLSLFIGPLAPFLDPGSLAFEQPERYGYRILFRTLEEHRQALLAPSWRYTLNYETEWMTRHQIMDVTYEAILRLTRLKASYGLISSKMAETQEWRIKKALELERRIGEIWCGDNHRQDLELLKPQVDKVNALRANERAELELPMGLGKLRYLSSLWSIVSGHC